MLKVKSKTDRVTEHNWFAWYPVLAEQKNVNGVTYYWVWMKQVRRRFIRSANIGQWSYTIQ